jgi:hypothetical protein
MRSGRFAEASRQLNLIDRSINACDLATLLLPVMPDIVPGAGMNTVLPLSGF